MKKKYLTVSIVLLLAGMSVAGHAQSAGGVVTVPYSMGFENSEAWMAWKVVDVNGDTGSYPAWVRGTDPWDAHSGAYMKFLTSEKNVGDDYLVSPKITLVAGKSYRVRYWIKTASLTSFETLAVYLATNPPPGASPADPVWMRSDIKSREWFEVEFMVTPGTGGDYAFVFHARAEWNLFFDEFSITEVAAVDAAVPQLFGARTLMAGRPFSYSAMVVNRGAQPLTGYAVQLLDVSNQVLSNHVPAPPVIAPGDTALVDLPYTPAVPGEGVWRAVIVLPGDEEVGNDTTPPFPVIIQPAGNRFESRIGTGTERSATLPFSFYFGSSRVQTLYFAHEMVMTPGVITEIQYFNDFASTDVTGKPVQIWLANTALRRLDGWLPESAFTLVYDGVMDFPAGQNTIALPLDAPFAYTGQNLVVMTNRPMDTRLYSELDRFYYTPSDGVFTGRTLYYVSDNTAFDGTQPATASNNVPHLGLSMLFEGGAVFGTVTSGAQPLEGAAVTIAGTRTTCLTTVGGHYRFPLLVPGDYRLVASKYGYEADTSAVITVTVNGEAEVNLSVRPLQTGTVSGRVVAGHTLEGLPGVAITLSGYADYATTANASGHYSIPGVYQGHTYHVQATWNGHAAHHATLAVDADAVTHNIVLHEYAYVVLNPTAAIDGRYMRVAWEAPGVTTFRYDNGAPASQLGFMGPAPNAVTGACHRTGAVLTAMQWFLTDVESAAPTTVHLFVFALNEDGQPTAELLYSARNVPSTRMEWNTHPFPEPVEAPNGFYIAMSHPEGFLALGSTVPDDVWPFPALAQYYSSDYLYDGFYPYEASDIFKNAMIRAQGRSMGAVGAEPAISANSAEDAPLEQYLVYRFPANAAETTWTLIASTAATAYIDTDWGSLPPGTYQYAVQAEYAGNNRSKAAVSNPVIKAPEMTGLTINGHAIETPFTSGITYLAACDETVVELLVEANAAVEISDGGVAYTPGQPIPLDSDKTSITIHLTAGTGAAYVVYTLDVTKALGSDLTPMYIERWGKVLAVVNNSDRNGGHVFDRYKWYYHNVEMPDSDRGYILLNGQPAADYAAEVHSTVTGAWHKLCRNIAPSPESIAVYPNPVKAGHAVRLRLPAGVDCVTARLFDVNGHEVITQNNIQQSITISCQPGIYLLQLQLLDGTMETQQLLVE